MALVDLVFLALAALTAAAARSDLRTGHIPNRLVAIGLAGGGALHVAASVSGFSAAELSLPPLLARAGLDTLLGALLCALGPLLLFRIEAMGGGDVKLLGVVGATVGPALGLQIELCAFLLVAVYAPVRLACDGQLGRLLESTLALLLNPILPERHRRPVRPATFTAVVFAPAIFFATVLVAVAERWPS